MVANFPQPEGRAGRAFDDGWARRGRAPFGAAAQRAARQATAILPAVVLFAAAISVPTIRFRWSEAWASGLWGLVLLGAFVGWGGLVNQALRPSALRGWGFDGAVGAALYLWGGAMLAVVHLVSPPAIRLFVWGGAAALGISRLRNAPNRSPRWLRAELVLFGLALIAVSAFALLQYGESITNEAFNVYDDNMAYRQFSQKLLETGSLYEPFSSRRMASFGGQTMLQAAMLAGAPNERLHVVDSGICVLLVLGLIVGYATSAARRAAALLAAVLFVSILHPRHNLGSEMSGIVFFLALFRFFDDGALETQRPWANAIVVGLLGAAACTLRQNYLSAAAITVAANYVLRFVSSRSEMRRRVARDAAFAAAASFTALLPWMITSYANAHTFLYPVMKGDTNPDWGLIGQVGFAEEVRWFLINASYFAPVRTIALFVVAGCLLASTRTTIAARAQLIGALVGFVLLVHFFQTAVDYESVARYYFAFVGAYALALTLRAASDGSMSSPRRLLPAILVTVGVAVHVYELRDELRRTYTDWLAGTRDAIRFRNPDRDKPPDAYERFYAWLQRSVPEHARMLVMLDYPYLLDFQRNDILNFDQPGALSPPPHQPYFQGPERFADYLKGLGIRYVAFVIGGSPEYNYPLWRGRLAQFIPKGARGGMYKSQARYYLDAFDDFMALTKSRKVLLHEGDYWVLDLGSPS